MKESTEFIIDTINQLVKDLSSGKITKEECREIFKSKISLQQLIDVFCDPDMDEEDMAANREMMEEIYGFKMEIN